MITHYSGNIIITHAWCPTLPGALGSPKQAVCHLTNLPVGYFTLGLRLHVPAIRPQFRSAVVFLPEKEKGNKVIGQLLCIISAWRGWTVWVPQETTTCSQSLITAQSSPFTPNQAQVETGFEPTLPCKLTPSFVTATASQALPLGILRAPGSTQVNSQLLKRCPKITG